FARLVALAGAVVKQRKYDPVAGAYGAVIPSNPVQLATGGWGAWEIAGRYGQISLNDLNVIGGELRNTMVGVNVCELKRPFQVRLDPQACSKGYRTSGKYRY